LCIGAGEAQEIVAHSLLFRRPKKDNKWRK
jgi:hypothetical protein